MIWILAGLIFVFLIFYFAIRILVGWTMPAGSVAAMDRGIDAIAKLVLKLVVLAIACGLLYIFWLAYTTSTP